MHSVLLIELDQHATGLHVVPHIADLPDTVGVVIVEAAQGTLSKPPTVTSLRCTVAPAAVVVALRSTKHHPVSAVHRVHPTSYRIPGVSAVSGHTQLILTSLITDGVRRVFCRVPQTAGTLDLSTITRY